MFFELCQQGEVAINHRIDVKSYTSLHTLVNDMFPPTSMVEQVLSCLAELCSVELTIFWLDTSADVSLQEDYNAWNFWKVPLPDIDA